MDMTGEYRIPAPRQAVWAALNDPLILKAAIPGCDELIKKSDTELEAKVTAKVGPVKAKFGGAVTLSDLNPPESYVISGQGSGGAAGFAKGGATVHLTEDGDGTILRYEAKADVGGKLAQIGSRLIQGTAKKMADDFFGNFSRIVADHAASAVAAAAPPTVAPDIPPVPLAAEPVAPVPVAPGPAAPQPIAAERIVAGPVAAQAEPWPEPRPVEEIDVDSDLPGELPAAAAEPAAMAPPQPVRREVPTRPADPPVHDRGGWGQSPIVWLAAVIVIILVLFLLLR
jgi:carbon monoxide dehydrogenase subunit G